MAKPPHYQGDYHVRARQVRMAAYADPRTRCWRCNLTLAECKPHRNGKPARWTAGHLRDSDPTSPLLPECSPCAASSGARYGNRLRGARRASQKATGSTQQPTSFRW